MQGIRELVELSQREFAAHVYRRASNGAWTFESLDGADAVLRLDSIGLLATLADIHVRGVRCL